MSFFRPAQPLYLKGPEAYLPTRVITNDTLIQWMGAGIRSSWIEHRTGIRERRWAEPDQACSDLAFQAASRLLQRFPNERDSIRQLVLASISGDYPTPPTAPLLQERLKLENVGAFDLGAACAGFVTGLHVSAALASGTNQTQLLVASDIRSKFLSPNDFATAALFGDGAAAVILSPNPTHANYQLIASQLFSDGSAADLISIDMGGSRLPFSLGGNEDQFRLKMKKGALLFLKAAEGMAESARRFLQSMNVSLMEIDWIVPHQANLHLIREIGRRLEVSSDKIVETVSFTGNTSGASVGIALHHLLKSDKHSSPKRVLLISAGGGGLAACALLESIPLPVSMI